MEDSSALVDQKEEVGDQDQCQLGWATRSGAWLTDSPHRLNSKDLSRYEFRDNIRLRYGIIPLTLTTE